MGLLTLLTKVVIKDIFQKTTLCVLSLCHVYTVNIVRLRYTRRQSNMKTNAE